MCCNLSCACALLQVEELNTEQVLCQSKTRSKACLHLREMCCNVHGARALLQVEELNEEQVLYGPGRHEQRDEKKLMVIFK
jgi:hypothetical protein